ncbi:hypothetical protein [Paractinoplanes atraurantiacus]|uniref:Uncharacterized protein n=1 Tax=Paractinoplanes atraurantiacus TaxID=1036182 RepID=A0A285H0V3_9ACTN|nr:hypothetical protein [Actinoplanes atraurantiacus]SNY29367.1 hypothetical protein SAMN05421748_103238 [Actinoplanes atraurantiacus]
MTERKLDALVIRWYERRTDATDVVARWLSAARAHLTEAVPRRFGESEPLRGRGDDNALQEAYAKADPMLFLAGSPPVYHATLAAANPRLGGPVAAHTMTGALDPADPQVREFALAMTRTGTIYVSASASTMELDGDTLYGQDRRREEPYLAPLGDWLGLPPEPPLWCWFGPGYTRLLRRHIEAEPLAGGLFHARGHGEWVPDRFRARLAEIDPARRHAPRMPRGLRRSALRLAFGGFRPERG